VSQLKGTARRAGPCATSRRRWRSSGRSPICSAGITSSRSTARSWVAYQKTCPIGELLARKEDKHLEFKSTLRWDMETGEKSRLIEGATIKTIAAFLNSEFGGTLVIGVADEGTIVGLRKDYETLRKEGKDDSDLFLLHLNQLVENAVGLAAAANVTTTIHHVDGRDVCRLHVEPSGHPVEAEVTTVDRQGQFGKKQAFFVRLNNGTRAIDDERERQRYIAHRWGAGG
jgi:type I restriction enzyme, R subunit